MTIHNPKPRFGYDDTLDKVFDYVTSRDVALTDKYETTDGTWDLRQVKALILSGAQITAALVGPAVAKPVAVAKPAVAAAAKTSPTPASGVSPSAPQAAHAGHVPHALTPADLIALKLTALQCGALGIKPSELTATGLTAERIEAMRVTPARAAALQLSAAQHTALASS